MSKWDKPVTGNLVGMMNWDETLLRPVLSLGQDKRLPVLFSLAMIILLAHSLAQLTWQVLPLPEMDEADLEMTAVRTTVSRSTQRPSQVQNISQWHLFGEVQKATPKPLAQTTDVPDTRLNLKLSGVLASNVAGQARAIIADGGGTEKAYAVGDTLPGNAILREIHADRVILESRGRLETLRLPKQRTASTTGPQARVTNIQVRRATGLNTGNASPSALLAQYKEALVSDPQSLMQLVQATLENNKATGKMKGYRLGHGKDRTLLAKFGLRSGDVLTAVNGVVLDNPIKGLEILQDLAAATSVNVTIERNGQPQSFTFNVD